MIEQVLKIDKNNVKAIMRKCNILIDMGEVEKCKENLEKLNEVAS